MTTEDQIQTIIKSQGGAENAIAWLLSYVEMREIEIKHFAHRGHTLKTIGEHIKQMEGENG